MNANLSFITISAIENEIWQSLTIFQFQEKIEIREVIPLAMLTAVKPFNFYR